MMILEGGEAFSGFRMQRLLERIRLLPGAPEITQLTLRRVYFLNPRDGAVLSSKERAHAVELLGTQTPFCPAGGFFVTPRKGTISPWSSKATDIFHHCGLTCLERVECGVYVIATAAAGAIVPLDALQPVLECFYDRMTEGVYLDVSDLFQACEPGALRQVDILGGGEAALIDANRAMGLALSEEEIDYLYRAYREISRNPTDVELVMFGQVNSEHCRHKIFNAAWEIDGLAQTRSLFDMIRHTHACHPRGTLVAYKDNSGVIEGRPADWFEVDVRGGRPVYRYLHDIADMLMKVETHNHPTAICPYPGAATGVGGEIRDEAATGTGGKSKAGLSAFMVSNLRIPGWIQPWEQVAAAAFPSRLATPLQIMLEGPIGGAAFGNEFGRPQLCGVFKTYEQRTRYGDYGYHKPIMVAGGMGNIKRRHTEKGDICAGALVLQLGGPAMRIGLGGGAASSMATGSNAAELDFDSVQRGNAEMQRRCQEVFDACIALGDDNPIISVHDIGAGGLSNGCPELVAESGGTFSLRDIPSEDRSMSPMEIWCCEAQERYVLAIREEHLDMFLALCRRERCPAAVIGRATGDGHLLLEDTWDGTRPIDMELGVLLGKPPRMLRKVSRMTRTFAAWPPPGLDLAEAAERLLRLPAVANKTFLITIADRSVSGCVTRDQMVGPYQTPLADVAVTATSYHGYHGESMAMGECTSVALLSGPASGRMAIGEALTNLAAADVGGLERVRLSANWMCACGEKGEDASLFDTVQAVAMDFCPQLGVSIPVGKDSLSMRTVWQDAAGTSCRMTSPLSLVVSAFATVGDVRNTVTPDLKPVDSVLLLIDLGRGRNRLGGSALAQVYNEVGDCPPDVDEPGDLAAFFAGIQELVRKGLLCAYHDRSDGGLFVTLAEMAFGSRSGLDIDLGPLGADVAAILFSEELGAVIQVAVEDLGAVRAVLRAHHLDVLTHELGTPCSGDRVQFRMKGEPVLVHSRADWQRIWSELTCKMQSLRDNPECAEQEVAALNDDTDPGMQFALTYDPAAAPHIAHAVRPQVAILREQGINGQREMAAAFDRAGFTAVDVHMTDLLERRMVLQDFSGLAACGGFSYGDVLGAGAGWAKSILFNAYLRDLFAEFFSRPETFALGVCNGCQMVAQLKALIPGAEDWPGFSRNRSEQFESRYVTVQVLPSPSVLLQGMAGARLPVPVAHGEGLADFSLTGSAAGVTAQQLSALHYVNSAGNPTEQYPLNPNGSQGGLTGFTSRDGRVTIMMPHPERAFRSVQLSYRPSGFCDGEDGPWMKMFRNARAFVD